MILRVKFSRCRAAPQGTHLRWYLQVRAPCETQISPAPSGDPAVALRGRGGPGRSLKESLAAFPPQRCRTRMEMGGQRGMPPCPQQELALPRVAFPGPEGRERAGSWPTAPARLPVTRPLTRCRTSRRGRSPRLGRPSGCPA